MSKMILQKETLWINPFHMSSCCWNSLSSVLSCIFSIHTAILFTYMLVVMMWNSDMQYWLVGAECNCREKEGVLSARIFKTLKFLYFYRFYQCAIGTVLVFKNGYDVYFVSFLGKSNLSWTFNVFLISVRWLCPFLDFFSAAPWRKHTSHGYFPL